jgi:hypothetical protein
MKVSAGRITAAAHLGDRVAALDAITHMHH